MTIKPSVGNFLMITIMAILGILLFKSIMGLYPVKGLQEIAYAI